MDSVSIIAIAFGILLIVGGPIVAHYATKASHKDALDTAEKAKKN